MSRIQPIDTTAAINVAAFRETLRAFMRESELNARASGLTPQRYLLLLMIKGAQDGSERSTVTDTRRTAAARTDHNHRPGGTSRETPRWSRARSRRRTLA